MRRHGASVHRAGTRPAGIEAALSCRVLAIAATMRAAHVQTPISTRRSAARHSQRSRRSATWRAVVEVLGPSSHAATVIGMTIVRAGSASAAVASAYSAVVTVPAANSADLSLSSVRLRKCVAGGLPPRVTGQRPSAAVSTRPTAFMSSRTRRAVVALDGARRFEMSYGLAQTRCGARAAQPFRRR